MSCIDLCAVVKIHHKNYDFSECGRNISKRKAGGRGVMFQTSPTSLWNYQSYYFNRIFPKNKFQVIKTVLKFGH